jgi:superfamily II DNA or RNA helicase
MIKLRDYQLQLINEVRKNLIKHKNICIQSPCGK